MVQSNSELRDIKLAIMVIQEARNTFLNIRNLGMKSNEGIIIFLTL